MDPKLAMLFLLVGIIIGLSHLSSESVAKWKRDFDVRWWRRCVSQPRKRYAVRLR